MDFVFWFIPLSFLSNGSKQDSITVLFFRHFLGNQLHSPPVRKSGKGPVPRQGPAAHPVSTGAMRALGPWGGVEGQNQDKEMNARSFSGLLPSSLGSEQASATQITCNTCLASVLTSAKAPYSGQAHTVRYACPPLGWAGHTGEAMGMQALSRCFVGTRHWGQGCGLSNQTPPTGSLMGGTDRLNTQSHIPVDA